MKPKSLKFQRSPKPWRTLGSRKLADAGEIKLYRDRLVSKTGFKASHMRLALHDFSVIVPVLSDNRLIFVWNYRHAIQGWELELPAGLIDEGETPQKGAKRELKEETGYSAKSWRSLGYLHTLAGISSQKAHIFLAKGLTKGRLKREPYEHMAVKILSIREAYRRLQSGQIIHSPTASALGLAERIILRPGRRPK